MDECYYFTDLVFGIMGYEIIKCSKSTLPSTKPEGDCDLEGRNGGGEEQATIFLAADTGFMPRREDLSNLLKCINEEIEFTVAAVLAASKNSM
jgi:hypothetical protein